jgi:hypothetical protein
MKRTLALLVFLAACGTDGSPGDDFIGTWMFNAGSSTTTTCPNGSTTDPDQGSFTVSEGTMSDLILNPAAGDKCPPRKFDVNGKTATIVAGQTCMYQENDPQLGNVTVNVAFATGTVTLSADKKMITGTGGGTIMLTAAAGNATCSFTSTTSATKVGN